MRWSQPLLFGLIGCLSLMGFGCKKPTPPTQPSYAWRTEVNQPSDGQTTNAPDVPSAPPVWHSDPKHPPRGRAISQEVQYLRQVIRNFSEVDTFRAHLHLPSADGSGEAEIAFVRHHGLHGNLQLPDGANTEVTLIGQDIYFRANTSSWTNLRYQPLGGQLASVFQAAFNLEGTASSSAISNAAKMLQVDDDPSGCRRYQFSQYNNQGIKEIREICVKDNLPAYTTVDTPNGKQTIQYRDYHQFIKIETPIIQ